MSLWCRDRASDMQSLDYHGPLQKAFDKEYCFKAWGTQVDSSSGRVGTPLQKLRQKHASKKALQKLLGLYVHPFMHRRECMSIFHHTYLFIDNLPEGVSRKIPQYICDELLTAVLLLPLASAILDSLCLHASLPRMPV